MFTNVEFCVISFKQKDKYIGYILLWKKPKCTSSISVVKGQPNIFVQIKQLLNAIATNGSAHIQQPDNPLHSTALLSFFFFKLRYPTTFIGSQMHRGLVLEAVNINSLLQYLKYGQTPRTAIEVRNSHWVPRPVQWLGAHLGFQGKSVG